MAIIAAENAFCAANATPDARATFIRRTYNHLGYAVLGFLGFEAMLFKTGFAERFFQMITSARSGYVWLAVLGAFMFVSWLANSLAKSQASTGIQYMGLVLYVAAEAVIFAPLLFLASQKAADVITIAGAITGALFLGLTATAMLTKKDFSFLGSILTMGGFIAVGVIVASIIFGFSLGLLFSSVMVLFAAGSILYTTSNILRVYNPDQHVAAALALFASVALLFWYVLRIVMAFTSRD